MLKSLYKPISTFFNRRTLLVSKKPGWVLFRKKFQEPLSASSGDVGLFLPRIDSNASVQRFLDLQPKQFEDRKLDYTQTDGGVFVYKVVSKLLVQSRVLVSSAVLSFDVGQIIVPSLCGRRVLVHNGATLTLLTVKRSMIGFSVKHFVRSKRLGSTIHTIKRKKSKKKQ